MDVSRNNFGGAILSVIENVKKLEALVFSNSWDSLSDAFELDSSSKIEDFAFTVNEFKFYDCIISTVVLLLYVSRNLNCYCIFVELIFYIGDNDIIFLCNG